MSDGFKSSSLTMLCIEVLFECQIGSLLLTAVEVGDTELQNYELTICLLTNPELNPELL
jgi:hypothetical protein